MSKRANYPMAFKGKRVLILWTTEAWNRGNEWTAFRVLDECDDGIFCEGLTRPDGMTHDGTKCFIDFDLTLDIQEWKEGA